jgi:hypothetical protein
VLTANDSAAQQFETVFPGFFVEAFETSAADVDRNGRISIWEAFTYASDAVRRYYEQRGRLATERPILDDTGDGIGREANGTGVDGQIAQVTYVQPDRPIPETGDSELTALYRRRAELESDLETLRARKPSMPPDEYDAALEKIVLEIARVDRQIRTRS